VRIVIDVLRVHDRGDRRVRLIGRLGVRVAIRLSAISASIRSMSAVGALNDASVSIVLSGPAFVARP